MDIDDVYTRTGELGWFQKKAFLVFCLANIFCGTQMVQNIFAGSLPSQVNCLSNSTIPGCSEECKNEPHSYGEDHFKSFATEWNMVCPDKATIAQSTQSIFMSGVMVGSFIVGGLGDHFGRLPVLIACEFLCAFFGLISSFMPIWSAYAAIRFITGFFLSGIIIVGFVLTSELVGSSKRNLVGTMPALAFACGICSLSFTAWITQNWRTMSAILGVYGLVLVPLMWWLYEESPRWHLSKGNTDHCKTVLHKIASTNGHDLGNLNLKVSSANGGSAENNSMLHLFRNKILLKLTLVMLLSWFTNSSVYYGLTIASGDMGSNKFVSVILNAFVEVPSNLIVVFLMNIPRLGRVRTCVSSMILSSIFCGSIWFISDDYKMTIVGAACAGKFFICMSFSIIYVQAAELYPTPVRNVGIGLLSVSNRIGGVLAPQVVNLEHLFHNAHFIVFGVLGCLSGALCYVLPETLGRPLPESVDDIYGKEKMEKEVIQLQGDRQKLLSDMDDEEEVEYNTSKM